MRHGVPSGHNNRSNVASSADFVGAPCTGAVRNRDFDRRRARTLVATRPARNGSLAAMIHAPALCSEVRAAFERGAPVLALESTIVAHGLP